ncbi:sensor domain-containing diguanylate cyclase [Desulfomicrobium escambiense]|uniref:sensor domain-containing diguanylate cyclase n=1 Tax=Desulfomicrobium escambiense TaxID=29503 RepID=UPI0003FFC8DE|nr:diguanylate cyclase [Desulfomicrobium escambiense]
MSIRTKVFLIIFVLFAALGAADFIIQRFIIYPSFLELEYREAGENLQRIFHAIDRETYHVGRLCRDWATWNDSHDFMATGSERFIESNLSDDSLDNISLNMIAFCDTRGNIVWSRVRDLEEKTTLQLGFMDGGHIDLKHTTLSVHPSPEGGRGNRGIFNTEAGPMLFASREILRSDGSGPSNGFLIMGRFLNQAMLETLKEQTRLSFEIVAPFDTSKMLCRTAGMKPMTVGDLHYFTKTEGGNMVSCAGYQDETGETLFGVQYLFPRETTRKGLASIRYAVFLVIGSGVTVLVILNLMMQAVVLRPLKRLTDHAVKLQEEGDYSLRLGLERKDEIGVLAKSLDSLVQTISDRTVELQRANEQLTQLSLNDALTGIANRRMFDVYLKQEWRRAMREQAPLSIMLADVDHFKNYNDTYGHQQGDMCLIGVAAVMQLHMQRPADLLARYGGEEFAVILPGTDAEGAGHIAGVLAQAVRDLRIEHSGSDAAPCVTLSIGVVTTIPSPEEGDGSMDILLEQADQALYQAKNSGRNKVQTWTPEQLKAE